MIRIIAVWVLVLALAAPAAAGLYSEFNIGLISSSYLGVDMGSHVIAGVIASGIQRHRGSDVLAKEDWHAIRLSLQPAKTLRLWGEAGGGGLRETTEVYDSETKTRKTVVLIDKSDFSVRIGATYDVPLGRRLGLRLAGSTGDFVGYPTTNYEVSLLYTVPEESWLAKLGMQRTTNGLRTVNALTAGFVWDI